MAEEGNTDDIQTKVLQTTLAEISSSRDGGDPSSSLPDCCVICLDAISEPCAALPCTHAHFDLLCLLSWLQERATCPLCKAAVREVGYQNEKQDEAIYRVPSAPGKDRDNTNTARSSEPPANEYFRRRRRRRSPHVALSRPADAIERRRHIYRHQLYSLHVGSNRVSQYRLPPTPNDFATTPHLVSRARLWIRRELQVFAFLSGDPLTDGDRAVQPSAGGSSAQQAQTQTRRRDNAEFLLEYIIAILKTVDMQGSAGQAEDMLSDFLGRDNARLLLHELRSWLRSPAQSLVAWDREVQYPEEHRKRRAASDDEDGHQQGEERQRRRPANGREGSWTWRDQRGGEHWRSSSGPDRKRRHQKPEDEVARRPRSRVRDG